jgi:hypothetical protein
MLLDYLCPPALLYVVVMLIYLILELSNKNYHQSFVHAIIGIIFACILQAFCQMEFSYLSWVIVMIPIIFYTYMTLLVFITFGLNPDKKLINKITNTQNILTKSSTIPPTTERPSMNIFKSLPGISPSQTTLSPSQTTLSPSQTTLSPSQTTSSISTTLSPTISTEESTSIYSDFCQQYINRPDNDNINYETECNNLSICSWNGAKCNTSADFSNKLKTLKIKCNNLDESSCSNNESCEYYDKCGPSFKGFANLLSNNDCKVYLKSISQQMLEMIKMPANMEQDPIKREQMLE